MKNTTEFVVSTALIELVKECEGFRAKPYRCPGGVITVGYGHTGGDVSADTVMTRRQAEIKLNEDLVRTGTSVMAMAANGKTVLTGNQTDALTSLAFNIGIDALRRSTLWRIILRNPNDPAIETEFNRWVHAGGTIQPGLVKRRRKEYAMYSHNK